MYQVEGIKNNVVCQVDALTNISYDTTLQNKHNIMVDLTVLPGSMYPGTAVAGNFVTWRGRKGRRFASRIGKRRRDVLIHFVKRKTKRLPVDISILLLDRIRPFAAYPITLRNGRNVGFVFGQFFLLIKFEDLKSCVQQTIAENDLTQQEMVDMVCS